MFDGNDFVTCQSIIKTEIYCISFSKYLVSFTHCNRCLNQIITEIEVIALFWSILNSVANAAKPAKNGVIVRRGLWMATTAVLTVNCFYAVTQWMLLVTPISVIHSYLGRHFVYYLFQMVILLHFFCLSIPIIAHRLIPLSIQYTNRYKMSIRIGENDVIRFDINNSLT